MDYLKKAQILQMENFRLLNEFERTAIEITKMENFTKNGATPKATRQLDWLREEILSRMS